MSHFCVLVIGDEYEKQLAPFHEFECTGKVDEYVKNVDKTEEAREQYETGEFTRLKDSEGDFHPPYEDQFYRDPTEEEKKKIGGGSGWGGGLSWDSRDWGDGKGYRAKINFIPAGYESVEVPVRELMSFFEYVQGEYRYKVIGVNQEPDILNDHKYGYIRTDGENVVEIIKRTNPDAKWDWYQVGGRYSGVFYVKGREQSDQARIKDIDFDRAYEEAEKKANADFSDWESIFSKYGKEAVGWSQFAKDGVDASVREAYNKQPLIRAMRESGLDMFKFYLECPIDDLGFDRASYVKKIRERTMVTFAVVKDGKWYERGEMGWWGSVSNEKGKDEWNAEFTSLLGGLDPETVLTAVDCHI